MSTMPEGCASLARTKSYSQNKIYCKAGLLLCGSGGATSTKRLVTSYAALNSRQLGGLIYFRMTAYYTDRKALVAVMLLILIGLLSACQPYNTDPAYAAKKFCACMKSHHAVDDYLLAYTICNAQLIEKSRYYRVITFNTKYSKYDQTVSYQTRDSAVQYMGHFLDYVAQNCCQESPPCRK